MSEPRLEALSTTLSKMNAAIEQISGDILVDPAFLQSDLRNPDSEYHLEQKISARLAKLPLSEKESQFVKSGILAELKIDSTESHQGMYEGLKTEQ